MTHDVGQVGEQLAVKHLQDSGLRILHRNWTCPTGEIDIIAEDGEYLLFVEVKTRHDTSAGHPLEAITRHKQKQILNTTKMFLQKNTHPHLQPRLDVISILYDKQQPIIDWIPNAFGDNGC